MAAQLISPNKQLPPYWQGPLLPYWQGPATPPVEGVNKQFLPKGCNLQWLLDVAWDWRNSHATPEVEISIRVPSDADMQEMERKAPNVAAIYRQQIADHIDCNRRMKPTRVVAWLHRLIVNQYGWPDRD